MNSNENKTESNPKEKKGTHPFSEIERSLDKDSTSRFKPTSRSLKAGKAWPIPFIAAIAMLLAVGCGDRKGSAEKAGESMDETLEEAQEKAKDMVDKDGPMEKAGESIDNAVDSTSDAIDNAFEPDTTDKD